jgi:hypothetical protein
MRQETTFIVISLIVLAGVAGAAFGTAYFPRTSTTTTVSTSRLVSTLTMFSTTTASIVSYATTSTVSGATTTVTTPNIELITRVYPASISSGQNVSINMELYNPLSTNFTIVSTVWQPQGYGCPGSFPFAFNIYKGHLDFGTVRGATPLLLYNASIAWLCFVGYNSTFTFKPDSDVVLDSSSIGQFTHQVNYTVVFSGSYFLNSTQTSPDRYTLEKFAPGNYTVLIFDRWGQQDIGYFMVA